MSLPIDPGRLRKVVFFKTEKKKQFFLDRFGSQSRACSTETHFWAQREPARPLAYQNQENSTTLDIYLVLVNPKP